MIKKDRWPYALGILARRPNQSTVSIRSFWHGLADELDAMGGMALRSKTLRSTFRGSKSGIKSSLDEYEPERWFRNGPLLLSSWALASWLLERRGITFQPSPDLRQNSARGCRD